MKGAKQMNNGNDCCKNETITATETAKILGCTVDTLVRAIENGTLPIGLAVRPENDRQRWVCKVFKNRLYKYMKGEI